MINKFFCEVVIPLIVVGALYLIWSVFVRGFILPETNDFFNAAQEGAKTFILPVFLSALTIITSFTLRAWLIKRNKRSKHK